MHAAMTLRTRLARAVRGPLFVAAVALAIVAAPGSADAELSLGLTGGMVFGADQQVSVNTFAPNGDVTSTVSNKRTPVGPGGIGALTLTYWLDPASPWGIQAEGIYWANSLSVRGSLPRVSVSESRAAVLVTLLGRWLLEGPGSAYFYGGFGGGLVYSRVSPGGSDFGPGFQALTGMGMMVTPNVRLRLELRYIVAPDIDPNKHTGDVTRTSGGGPTNPARRIFGSRFDTQFIPVMIGLDWVF